MHAYAWRGKRPEEEETGIRFWALLKRIGNAGKKTTRFEIFLGAHATEWTTQLLGIRKKTRVQAVF
jgi:hypothetical protein